MMKLLYITDQEEYSEHGTIGSFFHGYLKTYLHVNVVYFTKYKHSFQVKDDDFIVPIQYDNDIIAYLQEQSIDMDSYEFVFVRNVQNILKTVLKYRDFYGYKVGFRASFAKSTQAYEMAKRDKSGIIRQFRVAFGNWTKNRLINEVDIFMPTSLQMQHLFYPNLTCKIYPLSSALDSKQLQERPIRHDGICRLIYVGSLDALREFNVVLDALETIAALPWHLTLLVRTPEGVEQMLEHYHAINNKIEVIYTDELETMKAKVAQCDAGLALLPSCDLYNNALASKVVDYYSCAVPALLSDTQSNRAVFDEEEAFFSSFDHDGIVTLLHKVIETDEEHLIAMGKAGQKKLLDQGYDYEVMAEALFKVLARL